MSVKRRRVCVLREPHVSIRKAPISASTPPLLIHAPRIHASTERAPHSPVDSSVFVTMDSVDPIVRMEQITALDTSVLLVPTVSTMSARISVIVHQERLGNSVRKWTARRFQESVIMDLVLIVHSRRNHSSVNVIPDGRENSVM